jgi:hypothetical protein
MIDREAFLQEEGVVRLCDGGVNGNDDGIGNGVVEHIELEGGNVGTGDIDIFEGLSVTPFLPSTVDVPSRCQAV